ncbi:1-acyl-sn-glycerol-3-phosphate acyltransferase [Rhodovulum imhoffii]|uniref:1-acyl-sn-glycerol-3-phosphate acyltransferase n=1 Tax=Rhodovulum imhoffii TaxID=365340 RepID=A0A2T5BUM3_9RHOB|nr:lysophospholipid acyltransferase family protein [Rhodovulum imhoffii]MBK5934825.1 1-acyl-sn-glycerol-3-phosphate acyltransferase [Rhodovulum imhoffii]PTN03226.1 1-acyl-sn-glycerol-3-phosphate acyltransferase [Rhodovulum imhoffii]
MAHALQWLRSLLFVGQMYLAMPVFGLVLAPYVLLRRDGVFHAVHIYCHWVRWTARWMVGLRSEVRGTPPAGEVLIASKHQSFFDIILLVSVTPHPRFIMKQSLKWAPVLGWYAMRLGCVPVDRGKRGAAIAEMVKRVAEGQERPGQLIIYPQGTRVAPGVQRPYKIGTGVLYAQFGQDCLPAATNVGVFWPRTGIYRKPGLAVVEFLPVIPAGKPVDTFMSELEEAVESASNRLMAEAGFRG